MIPLSAKALLVTTPFTDTPIIDNLDEEFIVSYPHRSAVLVAMGLETHVASSDHPMSFVAAEDPFGRHN